eukprot:gb/GEZN01002928.1/.p1 GENE.gb/GEZN01002928.1/~~gb/GEZN01002928.1/.p1  ORF type:complete len:160 (+),score=8.66 gb/GEZN01002928.1/:1014-1493(+)
MLSRCRLFSALQRLLQSWVYSRDTVSSSRPSPPDTSLDSCFGSLLSRTLATLLRVGSCFQSLVEAIIATRPTGPAFRRIALSDAAFYVYLVYQSPSALYKQTWPYSRSCSFVRCALSVFGSLPPHGQCYRRLRPLAFDLLQLLLFFMLHMVYDSSPCPQ